MGSPGRHSVRGVVAVLTAVLACLSPSRPAVAPHRGVDAAQLAREAGGQWAPWIHRTSNRPYRLLDPRLTVAVAPRVADRLGPASVTGGLTAFDGVPGSAVDVTLLTPGSSDAPNVTVVQVACERHEGTQARARPHVAGVDANGAWVDTARIEVCPGLAERSPPYVRHLLAHELAHVLGLGHLCDDPECWPRDRPVDACEFMYPSVHPCQDLASVRALLPRLYPSGG